MTEIVRGQQGHPTPAGREAGPLADLDPGVALPGSDDWEQPQRAELAIDEARRALGGGEIDSVDGAASTANADA